MEKNQPQEKNGREQSTGRRQLLKMVAATTGTVGASLFLPAKWVKPIIDIVVLPAHAATSTVESLAVTQFSLSAASPRAGAKSPDVKNSFTPSHSADLDYEDLECELNKYNTTLQYFLDGEGKIYFQGGEGYPGMTLDQIDANITAAVDNCTGNIKFSFYLTNNHTHSNMGITLNTNGRISPLVSDTIPPGNYS